MISIGFIVVLWIKKDVAAIYTTAPAEQVVPLMITTVFVSLLKVGLIVGGVFLLKWLIGRIRSKTEKEKD